MKKINILRLLAITMVVIVLIAPNMLSVTRTISDVNDDVVTFIRNSNGNYYEATGANIHVAINNLDNNSGIVWLPGNTSIDPGSTIYMGENVVLDMQGCVLAPTESYDVIYMRQDSQVMNGMIDVSGFVMSPHHGCIYIDGIEQIGYGHTGVFNMEFLSDDYSGNAVYFNSTRPLIDNSYVYQTMWVTMDNIETYDFKYSLHMNASGGLPGAYNHSFINGHIFSNWLSSHDEWGIYLECPTKTGYDDGNNNTDGNHFDNFIIETFSAMEGHIFCDGDSNIFTLVPWDWNNSGYQAAFKQINFSDVSQFNYLLYYGTSGEIIDEGKRNTIINQYYSSIKLTELMSGYTGGTDTLQINKIGGGPVYFFRDFDDYNLANQLIRIYGNDSLQEHDYLSLGVYNTSGIANAFITAGLGLSRFTITGNDWLTLYGGAASEYIRLGEGDDIKATASNDIIFTHGVASGDHVRIDNTLRLIGRSDAPSETAGFVYYDTDDSNLYFFDGVSWVDLTSTSYAMDQDVETTDAVTFLSVDTGQGANELFGMDQNVLESSSPTFADITISDDFILADQLIRSSDTNTLIDLNEDNITIEVGGVSAVNIEEKDGSAYVNVTGQFAPVTFIIPCFGTPPATINGQTYFNTVNNSIAIYYDAAWHWHEED